MGHNTTTSVYIKENKKHIWNCTPLQYTNNSCICLFRQYLSSLLLTWTINAFEYNKMSNNSFKVLFTNDISTSLYTRLLTRTDDYITSHQRPLPSKRFFLNIFFWV